MKARNYRIVLAYERNLQVSQDNWEYLSSKKENKNRY